LYVFICVVSFERDQALAYSDDFKRHL
jgi:hypothetical protein